MRIPRRLRPSPAMAVALIALFLAGTGGATAGILVTSKDIKDGTIQLKDVSSKAQNGLRGRLGPAGPAGPQGPQGVPGTARAYGFVDNSSGTPAMSKAFGGVTVRRAGNGTFCITAPGIDPNTTPIVATPSAKSGAFAIIFVGSGLVFSQLCTSTEFQVLTVSPADFSVGLNNASFEFLIP